MRKLAALIALASAMLTVASACGSGGGGQPVPTSTVTPSLGKIQTPDGQYSVTKVDVGDRFPVDCSSVTCWVGPADCSFACSMRLKEGYQAVGVFFAPEFDGMAQALSDLCTDIYITASDGSNTHCYAWRGSVEQAGSGKYDMETLLFTPPASAHGFTLFVPDNPPVDLGK